MNISNKGQTDVKLFPQLNKINCNKIEIDGMEYSCLLHELKFSCIRGFRLFTWKFSFNKNWSAVTLETQVAHHWIVHSFRFHPMIPNKKKNNKRNKSWIKETKTHKLPHTIKFPSPQLNQQKSTCTCQACQKLISILWIFVSEKILSFNLTKWWNNHSYMFPFFLVVGR